ncbi:MAG TPA: SGNH/GDSL hydrolase family protein [Armatimonadota bacterium]|jgi:lysophospholipase L1-like esterase
MSIIKDGATILFQGDSITDVNRSRTDDTDLGAGFPMLTAAWLAAQRPERHVSVINRGLSGNRAKDLKERWQEDCIDLQPDIVSILIGVNDTWRRYDSGDPTSVEEYESNYRDILTRTREHTSAEIIILEPFLLPVLEDRNAWREDLDPKIHAARRLAREFEVLFVPLDGIFAAASARRDPSFWSPDSVHPSTAGHMLITQSWLKAVGEI